MKALPMWQPWASLVAVEAKRVETRSWPAPAWLIGQRIAIHATKTRRELHLVSAQPFRRRLRAAREAGSLLFVDGDLPLGAIVATAVIDRCTCMTTESCAALAKQDPDEHDFGHYEPGRYAWVLRDVQRLDPVIPFRGSQGMFDVPDDLLGFAPGQIAMPC